MEKDIGTAMGREALSHASHSKRLLQVQGLADSRSGLQTGLKDLFQEIYKSWSDRDFIEEGSSDCCQECHWHLNLEHQSFSVKHDLWTATPSADPVGSQQLLAKFISAVPFEHNRAQWLHKKTPDRRRTGDPQEKNKIGKNHQGV